MHLVNKLKMVLFLTLWPEKQHGSLLTYPNNFPSKFYFHPSCISFLNSSAKKIFLYFFLNFGTQKQSDPDVHKV